MATSRPMLGKLGAEGAGHAGDAGVEHVAVARSFAAKR